MRGSRYPDGVLVDQVALRRTETSKAEEIKRNRVDWTSRGMESGGEITINAVDNTRIDIKQLTGYVPNGEFISTTSDYYSIVLDDYTLGVVNYVCAVYTEDDIGNQPHESDGNVYPTEAALAWRIRVYSETNFLALPLTDNNLANDARDRCLLIGKVSANGVGNALTTSNIFNPTVYNNILYASPTVLTTITGVTILAVDSSTPTGDGTLTYDDTGAPNYTLRWQSSTGGLGPVETFTVDEIRDIADGSGNTIRVQVIISLLPVIGGSTTETITIVNLYYQDIPRLTGEDTLHRNFIGTGIVGPNNPHGLSADNIEGAATLSLLEEHQDIQHCNGIWRGSYLNTFAMSLTINTPPGGDTLNVQPPIAGDLYYVNGKKLDGMSPTSILFTPANFTAGALGTTVKEGSKLYEVYVDQNEALVVNLRTDTNPATLPVRTVTGTWIIDMSDDHPATTTYDLNCVVAAAVYTFSWGPTGGTTGDTVTIDNTVPPGASDPEGQIIRLYDDTGVHWIDLYVNRSSYGPSPDVKLPAATTSDTITVYAHLDYDQNMKIGSLLYWWDQTRGALGWETDFQAGGGVRHTIDRRHYGNLCAYEMADEALAVTDYYSTDELHYSGILFSRDELNGSFETDASLGVNLNFPVRGGHAYCRGQRLNIPADPTLVVIDNTNTLVYADYNGVIQSMDIGASTVFNNDLDAAMMWVIGSTYNRNADIDSPYISGDWDFAEKGVPLYYVQASAGVITGWLDVSRNINGPVDDWSVADRRWHKATLLAPTKLAAFDNLWAAFLHARVHKTMDREQVERVEIKVTGDNFIYEGYPITQPTHVDVVGISKDSDVITWDYAVDSSAAWVLSEGCRVSGLRFNAAITDVNNSGNVFLMANDTKVDNCKFIYSALSAGISNGYRIFNFRLGGGTLSNVYISDNYVDSTGDIFENFDAVTDVNSVYIVGNIFEGGGQTSAQSFLDIGSTSANNYFFWIRDNIIIAKTDALSYVVAVTLSGVDNVNIKDNVVFVEYDSGFTNWGIQLFACNYFNISGNTVIGGITYAPVFISGNNTSGYVIRQSTNGSLDNNYSIYNGTGIYLESADYISVKNNNIFGCYERGIRADISASYGGATVLSGFEVCDNNIYDGYKDNSASGSYLNLEAIDIAVTVSATLDEIRGVIVNNNNISKLTDLYSLNDCYGIHVDISGSGAGDDAEIHGLSIDNNTISEISKAGNDLYGIYLKLYPDDPDTSTPSVNGVRICNNNVSCAKNVASNTHGIVYDARSVTGDLNVGEVSIHENTVYIDVNPAANTAYGIQTVINSPTNLDISGNTIGSTHYGVFGRVDYGVIRNNKIIAGRFGIYTAGVEHESICENDVTIDPVDNTAACYGIWVSGDSFDITNNSVVLKGYAGANIYAGSVNIFVSINCSDFSIIGNTTRQLNTGISGVGLITHIFIDDDHSGQWTVGDNEIWNIAPSGNGVGLYVDVSAAPVNVRGHIRDNTVHNDTGSAQAFSVATPTGASWITANNNALVASYTVNFAVLYTIPGITSYSTAGGNDNNLVDSWDAFGSWTPVFF